MAQQVGERLIPIPQVVTAGGRRGWLSAALMGVGLGFTSLIVPHFFSDEVVMNFFGIFLGMCATVYLGFALSDGRYKSLRVEQVGVILFAVLATVALTIEQPLLIAGGWLGHALWDVLHPHPMTTRMPWWYAPLCIGFDVVVAGYLLLRFI